MSRGRRAPRSGHRPLIAIVTVISLVLVIAAVGGGYLLLRTLGSPRQTAASFFAAWKRAAYPEMANVSVNVPATGLSGAYRQVAADLGIKRQLLSLGAVTISGHTAQALVTVTDNLASGHVLTYTDHLNMVTRNRHWWVDWSPAAIYPGLRAGDRFTLRATWPSRGDVLAADGTVLSSPATLAQSGSLAMITGTVTPATAAQAKALGAPYHAGDPIGVGGVEESYQSTLAGQPTMSIRLTGTGGRDDLVTQFPGKPGQNVRTSIDLHVQLAASHAVIAANQTKPVDMVVIQPSTGHVLAVVESPGGFDRALEGIFPPGSAFKVVTASALAAKGMTPQSSVDCPSQTTIDGYVVHNDANEQYGTTTLLKAFAVSCNTTFAMLATQQLDGPSLAAMARTFGFNTTPNLGIPATLGHFTLPKDGATLASDAFGQGTDLVNPLSQASVAAAIADGTWRPPLLVTDPAPAQTAQPNQLSPAILSTLRPMMAAVVTDPNGTAAGVGFPPGVYGKTGTAEYGTGPTLQSHGWFIGYQGDIAFAVLVEGGGFGASSAGPIANTFLRGL